MKVLFVVDSISELTNKIDKIKNRFGDDITFIVKAHFVKLFKTFNYPTHAIYHTNLAKVMHEYLAQNGAQDVVVYYSSLNLKDPVLNTFIQTIGDKTKLVNLVPNYNFFETMENGLYNTYVKSMFKLKDSMASPKLQFLPEALVEELLMSHFGNKLFSLNPALTKNITVEDKELSKQLKIKPKFNAKDLIGIIAALLITIGLIVCLAFVKFNFLLVLLFICLYSLNLLISIILRYKEYFDVRFLK